MSNQLPPIELVSGCDDIIIPKARSLVASAKPAGYGPAVTECAMQTSVSEHEPMESSAPANKNQASSSGLVSNKETPKAAGKPDHSGALKRKRGRPPKHDMQVHRCSNCIHAVTIGADVESRHKKRDDDIESRRKKRDGDIGSVKRPFVIGNNNRSEENCSFPRGIAMFV